MASKPQDSDSEIKQSLLICKHCQSLIKDPKSLPCLHAYCTTCLQTLAQGKKTINCPQCGDSTKVPHGGVTAFPVASHLIALAEYVQLYMLNNPSIPCFNKGNKDRHKDAAVKCMECDVYYCNSCDKHHKKIKSARNHTAIKLSDIKKELFVKAAKKIVSTCEQHPETLIQYFCLDKECRKVVCQRCTTVKHKSHACIEIEEMAQEYRKSFTKAIKERIANRQVEFKKLQDEIRAAIKENEKGHKENIKLIKDHTKEMKKILKEKEKALLEEEEKLTNDITIYYTKVSEQVEEISTSLKHAEALIQNMASFSPDDEVVKHHEEIQKKIDRALQESTSPELWIQSVSVIPQGQPQVERKQEVRESKPMKCQDYMSESVSSLAVFSQMSIALHWYVDDKATAVYVEGPHHSKANALKVMIEKHCPKAYRVVPMVKDGQEKLAILSVNDTDAVTEIKILSVNSKDVENVDMKVSYRFHSITVDDKNNLIFTTLTKPKSIRMKFAQRSETLFTNQDGKEILDLPWFMASNINGDVIVSDGKKNTLLIFHKNGELTNTYKDFTPGDRLYPAGVCTCPAGWIYVSDRYGDCIHRLDKTGTFKDYIVTKEDGLCEPGPLQWYKGMLVVGQNNGQIKYFKI